VQDDTPSKRKNGESGCEKSENNFDKRNLEKKEKAQLTKRPHPVQHSISAVGFQEADEEAEDDTPSKHESGHAKMENNFDARI